ncbi:MAG: squalene synthase HpnC [Pseudomonadota bacterium]
MLSETETQRISAVPNQTGQVETPSGKAAKDENFPVGSFLIRRDLRPHVATFYAFARAIDDIADNPEASAEEKIDRLDAMAEAVAGQAYADDPAFSKAIALHHSLVETNVPVDHPHALIDAFRQDAVKSRYADWDDLMRYCDRSAAPVGRYLLDLHGEDRALFQGADALCNALQVINHLQDCGDDYAEMDRVYIPQDWLTEAGGETADLARPKASQGLRLTMDKMLEATDELLAEARTFPPALRSRRLAMESNVIIVIAERLVQALKQRDPLAERIELSKPEMLRAAASGIVRTFFR